MSDQNPIDLKPGDSQKDLSIMVYGGDVVNQKKIEAEFPKIQWSTRRIILQGDTDTPFLFYADVPFDQIPVQNNGLFFVQNVSPWTWLRRCYGANGLYGMGRGLILYEDRVSRWNDNLPTGDLINAGHSMRLSGDWNVKVAGDYLFKVRTANTTWFLLDGKKVINIPANNTVVDASEKVSLSPGVHRMEVVTVFNWEHQVPKIMVVPPDSTLEVPVDEYAASNEVTDNIVSSSKAR